jgi:TonB family protein
MNASLRSVLFVGAAIAALASSSAFAAFQPAKALNRPFPTYDYQLRKENVEGAVIVSLEIDAEGRVAYASIVGSSSRVFEEPTLDAVYKWQFTPAQQDGKAVSMKALQLVTFNNEDQNTPTSELVSKVRIRKGMSPFPADKLVSLVANTPAGEPFVCN